MTSLEDFVIKKVFAMFLFAISFLAGQSIVQVKLKNGTTVDGEFIGTYMEHIHLLTGENINYFKCDDIQSVTKSGYINLLKYDCSKNTVSVDILFPPQLNPMTGEWETIVPDVFNPEKRNFLANEEEKLARQKKRASKDKKKQEREALSKNNGWEVLAISQEQLEKTKNTFQEMINPKVTSTITDTFYKGSEEEPPQNKVQTNERALSSPSSNNTPQKKGRKKLTTYSYEDGTIGFSEDEMRKFIKKEIRKELRKALPYEVKKHKEQRQNKLFQNMLLGCGAWFLFMIMLS